MKIFSFCLQQQQQQGTAGCDGMEFNYRVLVGIKIGFISNKGGVDSIGEFLIMKNFIHSFF